MFLIKLHLCCELLSQYKMQKNIENNKTWKKTIPSGTFIDHALTIILTEQVSVENMCIQLYIESCILYMYL